jgi:uncharacterized protein (TIGR00730 family)
MSSTYRCHAVTVYCSSSNHVNKNYLDAAEQLGRLLAQHNYTLVFGGGNCGLMGALSAGARSESGRVQGIILEKFVELGVADPEVDDMRVVADMRGRKRALEEAGDAYIALPGGFGTFEELMEIISFKQLGFHNKPIVILNVNRYFDNLFRQIDSAFTQHFIETRFKNLYAVVEHPSDAIEVIRTYQPMHIDLKYRWPL